MVQTGPHLNVEKKKKKTYIRTVFGGCPNCDSKALILLSVHTTSTEHTDLPRHPCCQYREAVHAGGDDVHWRIDD